MLEMLNPKLLIHEIAHTLLFYFILYPTINTELLVQKKENVEIVNFLYKNCTCER